MKRYQRIVIVTRPAEALGFYEYFIRRRIFLRKFREARERRLFERALRNISRGENPSGWVLTRPSLKDKCIEVTQLAESSFIRWDTDLYYFPNPTVRDEWLNYHWKEYVLVNVGGETMMGRPVLHISGTSHSDK